MEYYRKKNIDEEWLDLKESLTKRSGCVLIPVALQFINNRSMGSHSGGGWVRR